MENNLYTVDEVSEKLKLSVGTIRERIRNGEIIATSDGKSYRISQPELDRLVNGKPLEAATSGTNSPEVEELARVVKEEIKIANDATELSRARTAQAEAEIKEREINGKRDLPDIIAQREQACVAKESKLIKEYQIYENLLANAQKQKQELDAREIELNQRDTEITSKEEKINDYNTERHIEGDSYKKAAISNCAAIDAAIVAKTTQLEDVKKRFTNTVEPLIADVSKYLREIERQANESYRLTESTKGHAQDVAVNKFNHEDAMSEKLRKAQNWLMGLLK